MENFATVIITANAENLNSSKSTALHEVCFKPLIDWAESAARQAGTSKVVVAAQSADVKEYLGFDRVFALCEQADSICAQAACAADFFGGFCGYVVILMTNSPFISPETIRLAVETCAKNDISAARITDKSGKKDIAYCCKVEGLTSDFLNGAKVLDICPDSEAICIDTRASLAYAQSVKQAEIVQKLIDKGVGIIDPKTVYISPDAEFEPDCTVYPNTVIRGRSRIAEGCIIGPSSTVENCKIGKNTEVVNSVISDSEFAENTSVGPFAYVRPGSAIGSDVKIGDFVEIKNSSIGDGTKVSHLTYVGDSDVGGGVNFGCGTVTVNYDGLAKHRTVIGDNAFIGCNTNLVAPVRVENNAFIAAGSTITDDVEAYSLAIARARQVDKKDWAKNAGWNTKNKK